MLDQCLPVFKCLNARGVKYLVIGGVAVIAHGVPRMTFDLDLMIEATEENAARLLEALLDAGFGTATLTTPQGLLSKEITIFRDRVRIDVQTATPGLVFAESWSRRRTMEFRGQPFHVVSRQDLIRAKEAAGRPIDLEDVQVLQALGDAEEPPPDRDEGHLGDSPA